MGVVCVVCVALMVGCNRNDAELQRLRSENTELKSKIAAIEQENAKLRSEQSAAEAGLKVDDSVKPIVAVGKDTGTRLNIFIKGNRVVAEDMDKGGIKWATPVEGKEVWALSLSGVHLFVTTDKLKYDLHAFTGKENAKAEPVKI